MKSKRLTEKTGKHSKPVIPGRPEGSGPESMNSGLWDMDPGFAAAPRPGACRPKA